MARYIDSCRGGTLATLTINGSGNSILFVINLYRCFNEQHLVSLPHKLSARVLAMHTVDRRGSRTVSIPAGPGSD